MMSKIASVSNIQSLQKTQSANKATATQNKEFDNVLGDALKEYVETENTNTENISKIASGDLSNINEALIGVVEADLTLQYTMQIRNKIVDAYKEIMGMQV